jgi:dehydrogenase/reductase SDR family member 1
MGNLDGAVALVAGATRQVGRGVAVGLAEAGATVYISSRRVTPGKRTSLGNPYWGSLNNTLAEIKKVGGQAIAVRCDHMKDDQTRALIDRIESEQGRIDVLVNAVWSGYDRMRGAFPEDGKFDSDASFYEQPIQFWDENFSGVRAAYVLSALTSPLMARQQSGLICHITYRSAREYTSNVAYGVSHAAIERMASDMAADLQPSKVACIALCPMGHVEDRHEGDKDAESGIYIGRCIEALFLDPNQMEMTGSVLGTRLLGRKYGVLDADGMEPPFPRDISQWYKLYPEWKT